MRAHVLGQAVDPGRQNGHLDLGGAGIAFVDPVCGDRFRLLKGRAGIANAKLAYRLFRRKFDEPRWKAIAEKGGRLQQPLWASTSVKNPAYHDVMYAEELIGPDTINTMPPKLIDAFRDHGTVERTVDKRLGVAEGLIREIEAVGISMKDVTDTLLVEGIASFQKSFDSLTAGIAKKMSSLAASAGFWRASTAAQRI